MTRRHGSAHLDTDRHPIRDQDHIAECGERLDRDGALVLAGFTRAETIDRIVEP